MLRDVVAKSRGSRVGFLALAIIFLAVVFVVRIGGDMVDFEVNYRAGTRLLAGESLYPTTDGHFMYKYFPFAAMLYVPLQPLSLGAAKAVWYAFTVLTTIAMFVLSRRLAMFGGEASGLVRWLPPLVLAKFCFRELKLGQIDTIVVLVLLLALLALVHEQRREAGAGALWGLATAIKPYGLIFLPYFLVRRSWKTLGAGASVLTAAFFLPSLFYGFDGNLALHREWVATLTKSTPAQLTVNDNVSIVGFIAKWSAAPELASRLALLTTSLLAGIVLFVMYRGRGLHRAPVLEFALLLTLIPLVSPLGWDYQLLSSVLALSLLAAHWNALGPRSRLVLGVNLAMIALTIYDVIGRDAYRAFMSRSILTLNFVVVVGYLVWLRGRRLA